MVGACSLSSLDIALKLNMFSCLAPAFTGAPLVPKGAPEMLARDIKERLEHIRWACLDYTLRCGSLLARILLKVGNWVRTPTFEIACARRCIEDWRPVCRFTLLTKASALSHHMVRGRAWILLMRLWLPAASLKVLNLSILWKSHALPRMCRMFAAPRSALTASSGIWKGTRSTAFLKGCVHVRCTLAPCSSFPKGQQKFRAAKEP